MPFDHTKLDKVSVRRFTRRKRSNVCGDLQEEEQKRLELEMQKRRERIERWRAERKKKELEATKKDGKTSILANLQLPMKKWSLEDDSDEETPVVQNNKEAKEEGVKEEIEEVKEEVKDEEEEIDPLDAFMAEASIAIIYIFKSILYIYLHLINSTGPRRSEESE